MCIRDRVNVEISTAGGAKLYPIVIGKNPETDTEVFNLPSDAAPLMVLFDKGGHVLKSADVHKEKKEWLYQLKNAGELADRADAVVALAKMTKDDDAIAAVGDAMLNDKTWGLRTIAIEALGRVDTPAATKLLLEALEKSGSSAPDAAFLNGERTSGPAALRTLFQNVMATFNSDLTLHSQNTETSGELAYDSGDFQETLTTIATGARTNYKGNYLIIFKRQPAGPWLIVQHVWTLAQPTTK